MDCYIFDIDGTLADNTHRLHFIGGMQQATEKEIYGEGSDEPIDVVPIVKLKDWDAFFDACGGDPTIEPVCNLANYLEEYAAAVIVTGRPERIRDKTEKWLAQAMIPFEALYMRKDGDYREDWIIKEELLDQLLFDGWNPVMVFEDRKRCVDMWRRRGLICAQVAEGDY